VQAPCLAGCAPCLSREVASVDWFRGRFSAPSLRTDAAVVGTGRARLSCAANVVAADERRARPAVGVAREAGLIAGAQAVAAQDRSLATVTWAGQAGSDRAMPGQMEGQHDYRIREHCHQQLV
jgi:hypothetical protein